MAGRHRRAGSPRKPDARKSGCEGVLVVLVAPEARGKDMLIAAARRRFATDHAIEFPFPIMTRPAGENDQHIGVSRRQFRDMVTAGTMLTWWETSGREIGFPSTVRASLEAGRMVVVAASPQALPGVRAAWPRVEIVELTIGPDFLKAQAAASAMTSSNAVERSRPGPIGRPSRGIVTARAFASQPCNTLPRSRAMRSLARPPADPAGPRTCRIDHAGDIAEAVRAFHGLLDQLSAARNTRYAS